MRRVLGVYHERASLRRWPYATAGWVDWYNTRRLHGSLGTVSQLEFETTHYATLNPEP